MGLSGTVTETRPYLSDWQVNITVTDSDTGRIYNRQFAIDHDPSAAEKTAFVNLAKERIQRGLDLADNGMNLTSDEDRLLEYYRNIKTDIILRIRALPDATAQQASDYIASEYPNSPFDFAQLYAIWQNITNTSTWAQFKTFCIDHKFRDID